MKFMVTIEPEDSRITAAVLAEVIEPITDMCGIELEVENVVRGEDFARFGLADPRLRNLLDDAIAALVDDESNDAEHDALYALVQELDPERLSTAEGIAAATDTNDEQ